MVVSMAAIYSAMSELQGVSQYQELIDLELLKMGGWLAAEMTPHLSAPGVKLPVLMIQVLEDEWTRNPEDAQKIFDLLGSNRRNCSGSKTPRNVSGMVTITSEGLRKKCSHSSISI
jgi:hypothetical protein